MIQCEYNGCEMSDWYFPIQWGSLCAEVDCHWSPGSSCPPWGQSWQPPQRDHIFQVCTDAWWVVPALWLLVFASPWEFKAHMTWHLAIFVVWKCPSVLVEWMKCVIQYKSPSYVFLTLTFWVINSEYAVLASGLIQSLKWLVERALLWQCSREKKGFLLIILRWVDTSLSEVIKIVAEKVV